MRARRPAGLLAVMLLCLASTARAEIPLFNGTCPGNIEVHADDGGPIFLNGREARLKRFSDSYYEASGGRTTVSVTINPDGSVGLSYTGRGGANGVCQIVTSSGESDRRPARTEVPRRGRSEADVGDLSRECRGEASAAFDVRPGRVTTNAPIQQKNGTVVQGWFDGRDGTTFFNCRFDADGEFVSVN